MPGNSGLDSFKWQVEGGQFQMAGRRGVSFKRQVEGGGGQFQMAGRRGGGRFKEQGEVGDQYKIPGRYTTCITFKEIDSKINICLTFFPLSLVREGVRMLGTIPPTKLDEIIPPVADFPARHIGPRKHDARQVLICLFVYFCNRR